MKLCRIIIRLLLLAVVRSAVAAEGGSTSPALGLNFDTAFETYIGPALIFEGDESRVEAANSPVSPEKLQLQFLTDPNLSIERIRNLRDAGALELAETLLVIGLQGREGSDEWFEWQRELWEIRAVTDRPEPSIKTLVTLAGKVKGEQRLEVLEQLVKARQSGGDLVAARAGLRELMLMSGHDPVRIARLRRLLIYNYLESGSLADAEAASVRYQDEYLPDDTEWSLLRARILIENDESSQAVVQLAGLQNRKAQLMLVLARLRESSLQPDAAIAYLENDELKTSNSRELERFRIAIAAEAARLSNQPEILVRSLENLMVTGNDRVPMLPKITPERLLAAYYQLAENVGNNAHLLRGNEAEWLLYASELSAADSISARAIFALVLQTDLRGVTAIEAHKRLVTSMLDDGLYPVVMELYGESSPLGPLVGLGDSVSMRLSQEALQRGNYILAAHLAKQVDMIPEGLSQMLWQLQVARLEVFSGNPQAGSDRLLDILHQSEEITEEELDQLLQVAFDLQSISHHDLALAVFKAASRHTYTVRQRREMFFWMGESQIGKGQFARGADLLLQSAEFGHHHLDLWGQSARFRAAEAMVNAGLLRDARDIYRSLLHESSDEKRRMQLRQKLQNLRLLETVQIE